MFNKVKHIILTVLLVTTLFVSTFQTTVFAAEGETISVVGNNNELLLDETNYTFAEDTTAFDVLVQAVGESQVKYSESEYGVFITEINGLEAKDPYYWAFYVNGVQAQVGADSYVVQEGDEISFRYTDWTKPSENSVSLQIIGDKDHVILPEPSSIAYIDQPTAFDLLQIGYGQENIEYETSEYGVMITSIGGLAAEGTYYWAFYVNDEMASVGVDIYKLQKADKVTLKYESWETPAEEPTEEEQQPEQEQQPVEEFDQAALKNAINAASQYVLKQEVGDWQAVALNKAGKTLPASYLENLKKQLTERQGSFSKITDYERLTLGVLAAGEDPSNIEGYNLVQAIYNGNVTKQGLNGVAYALIALDSANFEVPSSAKWSREALVNELLKNQNDDGGWTWSGEATSDSDTTAMVLTALAPYVKSNADVKSAVDEAVKYLSAQYKNSKIDNSSTAAQVVIALSALSIDSHSDQFTKDGVSLIDYLLSYQNDDGGFDWQGGDTSDSFTTDQGYRGIVAYQLFLNGKGSLYSLILEKKNTETPADNNETPVVVKEDVDKDTSENVSTTKNDQPAKTKGYPLPNTATQSYNMALIGLALLIIGITSLYVRKRQQQ